jgi:hypothetical protein
MKDKCRHEAADDTMLQALASRVLFVIRAFSLLRAAGILPFCLLATPSLAAASVSLVFSG